MSWAHRINNRDSYLSELRTHLERLPASERDDILRDQDEFFREAVLSGRTEADVIGSLGDPKQLAKTLIAESRVAASEVAFRGVDQTPGAAPQAASFSTQMNATLRAFLAIITLAPFNLFFVVGPFIGLMACLFVAWMIGGASLIGGLASFVFIATELVGVGASGWAHLASVFFAIGLTMCSVAFLGLMTQVTSWIAQASVRYLRWNLDLIVERK